MTFHATDSPCKNDFLCNYDFLGCLYCAVPQTTQAARAFSNMPSTCLPPRLPRHFHLFMSTVLDLLPNRCTDLVNRAISWLSINQSYSQISVSADLTGWDNSTDSHSGKHSHCNTMTGIIGTDTANTIVVCHNHEVKQTTEKLVLTCNLPAKHLTNLSEINQLFFNYDLFAHKPITTQSWADSSCQPIHLMNSS